MKKVIIIIISWLIVFSAVAEDTGKYLLLDYQVKLTPYSDGKVKMEYYQKWQVTEGHIPWITIGMPNSDYQITGQKLAVKKITMETGDFTGVRIDLDKDYKPGETFEVFFSADENKLFYSEDSAYVLEFTPGWYERAKIDNLKITVKFFAKLNTVTADPKPTSINGEEMSWIKTKLAEGEKLGIKVTFPQALFPKGIPEDNLTSNGLGVLGWILIIILIIFLVCLVIALIASAADGDGYSGGGIFFGGGGGGGGGISSGGGGGFGGSSSSCACACVSCACACACAGGGGAGCSRKDHHQCPICHPDKEEEDQK